MKPKDGKKGKCVCEAFIRSYQSYSSTYAFNIAFVLGITWALTGPSLD